MIFNTGSALLDAVVLAVISKEGEIGSYGYKITQDTMKVIDISESTLYPVLRRLRSENLLGVYDKAYDGRNRRYYYLTEQGYQRLGEYSSEWKIYCEKIDSLLKEARYE